MSSHQHHHDAEKIDLEHLYSQESWDARYAESDRIWSGNPNPWLVEHAADLTPRDALDVGCGEGADAVWLATKGWRVTALDVSTVALDRAAEHARGAGVADRVTVLHHDLMRAGPPPGEYSLVSSQFMHPPADEFAAFFGGLGATVRPGGTLLIVGHHPDDIATGVREPHGPDLLFTPERVVAALDPEDWEIRQADARTREWSRDDVIVTVTDTVVVAQRRPTP